MKWLAGGATVLALTLGVGPTLAEPSVVRASGASSDLSSGPAPRSTRQLSDPELWQRLEKSERSVAIGLKAPQLAHGVVDGEVLLDDEAWGQAQRAVASVNGITVLWRDDRLPLVTARVDHAHALGVLRRSEHVDYVEPLLAKFEPQSSGCEDEPWGTKAGARPLEYLDGDVLPWNFRSHRVPEAWRRGAYGHGIKVAVTDTGVYSDQSQLRSAADYPGGRFTSGASGGRTLELVSTRPGSTSPFDECSHGTRTAGTVAAPRDGRNVVGVAYGSSLVSVRIADDVVVDPWSTDGPMLGLRAAVETHGAKIVEMAWGGPHYDSIYNEIARLHRNYDVLFVAAAGTAPGAGGMCPTVYPAAYDQYVVAVSGVKEDSSEFHPDACRSDSVDLVAAIGEVPAPGRNGLEIQHYGGTSAASALVAGVAAQIWSTYPWMNRDQVRHRLYWGAQPLPIAPTGWGRADAYKSVGGFVGLHIHGPSWVDPNLAYELTGVPFGEGPFAYAWSDGQTTRSIWVMSGAPGTEQSFSLTVTDLRDGTVRTVHHRVFVPEEDWDCGSWAC